MTCHYYLNSSAKLCDIKSKVSRTAVDTLKTTEGEGKNNRIEANTSDCKPCSATSWWRNLGQVLAFLG